MTDIIRGKIRKYESICKGLRWIDQGFSNFEVHTDHLVSH